MGPPPFIKVVWHGTRYKNDPLLVGLSDPQFEIRGDISFYDPPQVFGPPLAHSYLFVGAKLDQTALSKVVGYSTRNKNNTPCGGLSPLHLEI